MKSQLRETEDELSVIHLKHQRHHEESEQRRSRLSSSLSSQEDLSSRQLEIEEPKPLELLDNNFNLSMDFKRNKEVSFQNTISLVSNLINELDSRARKLRVKKKSTAL